MSFQWGRGGDGGRRNSDNPETAGRLPSHGTLASAHFSSQMMCRGILPNQFSTWNGAPQQLCVFICSFMHTHCKQEAPVRRGAVVTCSFQDCQPEVSVEESQDALNHLECIPQLNPWSWKSPGLSKGTSIWMVPGPPPAISEGQQSQGSGAAKGKPLHSPTNIKLSIISSNSCFQGKRKSRLQSCFHFCTRRKRRKRGEH